MMNSAATLATHVGEYAVMQVAIPGSSQLNAGVLLLDPANNQLYMRFRRDWDEIADSENVEVLELLAADIAQKAGELGASEFLSWMEEHLSNVVQISDRETVLV